MATESGIIQAAVTVSTTATELCLAKTRRTLLTFTNNGSVNVYLGGSGVTSSAFLWVVEPGDIAVFTTDGGDVSPRTRWYGVTASSSASVSVGEVLD